MTQKSALLNKPNHKVDWRMVLIEFFVSVLILVYIYTAISKLIDFRSFSVQLSQNPIFKDNFQFYAFAGPILELMIAFALVFKKSRGIGLMVSTLLMAFFTWYVIYLMKTLPELPCSCGGIVGWLSWNQHLALNISLTIFSALGYIMWRARKK